MKPLERQPSNAILKTCAKAGCIWIVSMIIAVPEAIFSNVYTFQDPNKNMTFESCAFYPVSERLLQEIHSLLCFLVFYIIPLSIISVYYSLIARTLYKSTLNIPTEEQRHARKQVCINQDSCVNLEVQFLVHSKHSINGKTTVSRKGAAEVWEQSKLFTPWNSEEHCTR